MRLSRGVDPLKLPENSAPFASLPVILWREGAGKLKIKKVEIDRMASAFEHADLQKALQ